MDRVATEERGAEVGSKLSNWLVWRSISYSYAKKGSWSKLDRRAPANRNHGELQRQLYLKRESVLYSTKNIGRISITNCIGKDWPNVIYRYNLSSLFPFFSFLFSSFFPSFLFFAPVVLQAPSMKKLPKFCVHLTNRFGPEYKAELARSCDCVTNS